MKTQHTPGPWKVESNQFLVWSENKAVACAYGTNAPEPMATEARANALLIAAAPDLLAALRCIVATLSQPVQDSDSKDAAAILRGDAAMARNVARLAIARTEGKQL